MLDLPLGLCIRFEGFKVLVLCAISDARFGLQWGIYGSGMGLFFATA